MMIATAAQMMAQMRKFLAPALVYQIADSLDETVVPLPFKDAGVAQLAEQLFCKQQVTGSIPVAGSTCMCKFG
jgi:hypothetical protein